MYEKNGRFSSQFYNNCKYAIFQYDMKIKCIAEVDIMKLPELSKLHRRLYLFFLR